MELEKITNETFDKLYSLMEQDFPEVERRTKDDQKNLLKNKAVSLNFIKNDNAITGYFIYWDLGEFLFIEHIATLKEFRGQGLGTKFLKNFIKQSNKNILLEVELPTDKVSIMRISFYEHLGFVLNDYDYTQPSYHNGGDEQPMKIMTIKEKLSKSDYDRYTKKIKKVVYKI